MQTEDLVFTAAGHQLAATKISPFMPVFPSVLTLHGLGATATRHSIRYVLDYLAQHDHASMCFEFSGNGESTGVLDESSLWQRQAEALAAARFFGCVTCSFDKSTSVNSFLSSCISGICEEIKV